MKFNSFLKPFLFGITVVFFISCDKDFNEIGADFVDSDHYNFATQKYDVVAYNQNLGPVQTNNLPINALGYYNNPVFGRTKANFVTQLELASVNPTFILNPTNIQIDSVYLHVPYFSKLTATDANGDSTYTLDSIYGSGKIKLEVFRSNYYLRNLDPNPISGLLEQQSYFSDQTDIETQTLAAYPNRLNNNTALTPIDQTYQNNNFEFRNTQIKFYKTDGTTVRERLAPGIYMDLDPDTFEHDIIQAGAANLADNNAFKNYYRGLFFKVTPHADNLSGAALAQLNFAQGKIVIVYKDAKSSTELTTLVRKTMTLNMKGYTVNLIENSNNGTNGGYTTELNNNIPNGPTGDEKLYLKGSQGSMAVIDLFGGVSNDNSLDLATMRNENWLINEANLVFTINDNPSSLGNSLSGLGDNPLELEANRILLYDLNNKRPLIDYFIDSSTNLNVKFNKLVHSGIVQKASVTDRGTRYKIRITNHIRNLIKYGGPNVTKDSTNVKLGLVITENINTTAIAKVKNPFSYIAMNPNTGLFETKTSKYIPLSSVMSPLGTVLYGSSSSVDAANRLQLEIVYTKPD